MVREETLFEFYFDGDYRIYDSSFFNPFFWNAC